jgi:hypothetical protein
MDMIINLSEMGDELPINDTDYLSSIPDMVKLLKEGMNSPSSNCIDWTDV